MFNRAYSEVGPTVLSGAYSDPMHSEEGSIDFNGAYSEVGAIVLNGSYSEVVSLSAMELT